VNEAEIAHSMSLRALNILHVNTSDLKGGADKVAWNLCLSMRARGHGSRLVVGFKVNADADVAALFHGKEHWGWSRFWWTAHSILQVLDSNGRCSRLGVKLAEPGALLDWWRGIENFRFPGTWRLLSSVSKPIDILHCHNLHGGYFDLRALSWLSHQVTTVITLHDSWLLSGHCAHSLDCERWQSGCGQCPDLTLYPAVRHDATAYNWQRKREIYQRSRLYIAAPSHWLVKKVQDSILAPAVVEAKVIPNGVDLNIFHPGDRNNARVSLGLSPSAKIVLFAANGIRDNVWKDYRTLREAIFKIANSADSPPLLCIALGEKAPAEHIGRSEIRFVPYQKAPEAVASYYQAADLYVHAARADTFPNTVLEALSCGTPVVATAVGGIPEQIKGLKTDDSSVNRYGLDEATGFLTPPGNAEELGMRLERLLSDEPLRRQMSDNAVADARQRFSLKRQVDAYLDWYQEIRQSVDMNQAHI
jgi:glycosyltransferase involved in cell wall biosynthesis